MLVACLNSGNLTLQSVSWLQADSPGDDHFCTTCSAGNIRWALVIVGG